MGGTLRGRYGFNSQPSRPLAGSTAISFWANPRAARSRHIAKVTKGLIIGLRTLFPVSSRNTEFGEHSIRDSSPVRRSQDNYGGETIELKPFYPSRGKRARSFRSAEPIFPPFHARLPH